jgi:hypothetical protein
MKLHLKSILIAPIALLIYSCVEEINLVDEVTFESVLVVEAIITNELKQQEVKLSRTTRLEDEESIFEYGATVKVIGNAMTYNFFESVPGVYKSINSFVASPDIDYQLEIALNNGEVYKSSLEQLTNQTVMDTVYASRSLNENNDEGVSIFIDAFDSTGNSIYYRYEFEETYKIIAPYWVAEDLECVPDDETGQINLVFSNRSQDEIICYNTVKSNDIIIINTKNLSEDRLDQFRVRFIDRDNYIMSHRYSIEVKQYIQSQGAYRYYEILKEASSASGGVLSQIQVGYLEGNMSNINNSDEKVIGYFEVSSIDIKRIYFNYEDIFPNEVLPPYAISCVPFSPDIRFLCDALSPSQGNKYYEENLNPDPTESFVYLVAAACGNCTVLGESSPPDFWIE